VQLDHILKNAVIKGASDVHLSPLTPPIIRVNTRLIKLNEEAMHKEELEQMALCILGLDNYKVFDAQGRSIPPIISTGGELRVNIYRHRGMIAIAARIIKTEIPTLNTGLPKPLEPCALSQRADFGDRPTGSGNLLLWPV
jgi:twitching motility protein PilT